MKILLVCGSRDWTDEARICAELDARRPDVVMHGGCRGADMIADYHAKARGIHTNRVDALWNVNGKAAGPMRNEIMAKMMSALMESNIVEAVAFHSNIEHSKGTKDMVVQLQAHYINCDIISG